MTTYQACVYSNMYMLRSVYFGYSIVDLTIKQENELKELYEVPLIKELRLSTKLLKAIIYTRKLARELRLL